MQIFQSLKFKLACREHHQENLPKKNSRTEKLVPPKAILDAAIQTISTDRSDGSCQTDDPERNDFQAQAHFEKQGESIATQTESPEKCDSEVQANIRQESESLPPLVPAPVIKQEIVMPNIPSSMAQTPAKKRKLLEFIGMELDNLYIEREYVERNYVERNEFF